MTKKSFFALALIFVLGLALMGAAQAAKKFRSVSDNNGIYDIKNVNALDAFFARPYNKGLDGWGTALVLFVNFVAAAFAAGHDFFSSKEKKAALNDVFYDALTFVSCWLWAGGLYRLLKTVAGRIRPYMYFPNPSQKGILEGDFCRSWPSGHSTAVFIALAFFLSWISFRKKSGSLLPRGEKVSKALAFILLFVCLLTLYLRVACGKHFLTDVVSGAAIGFFASGAIFAFCGKALKAS